MMRRLLMLVSTLILFASLLAAGSAPAGDAIESIQIHPPRLGSLVIGTSHGIVVTARTRSDFLMDKTGEVECRVINTAVAAIDDSGTVRALAEGETRLVVRYQDFSTSVAIKVIPAAFKSLSFKNDILPVLSRAGCNAGECHANASGQAGFKLSVFAFDKKSDFREIVKDARGRRVFPADPQRSLILLKPTQSIEHGGGKRFEKDSDFYRTLETWIRNGMAYENPEEPELVAIDAYPKEGRYAQGARQRLVVQASYSDGTVRDVTELSGFSSEAKEIATADASGRITLGRHSGEGTVVARYMGLVAVSLATIPPEVRIPEEFYHVLPIENDIDRLVYLRYRKLGILPSDLCDDSTFLRRATLDVVGALPTVDEALAFAADKDPEKRHKLIDHLLKDPRYADFWATKWGDLIRPNPARVGVKSVRVFDLWIRRSLRENKPYDQFVREIITAQGTTHRDGPSVLFRDRRKPEDVTTLISRIFLGVRMECAKCHHHPNEKWSQKDFYQLAAFFGEVGRKGKGISPPISGSTEFIFHKPGGKVKHPVSGEVMKPTPLAGEALDIEPGVDPREKLADWMADPDNPYFAPAIVNRIWSELMGRGIVDPVDDFRASNPPTNPELLEWISRDFIAHDYDLKHLIRRIVQSRTYQLSSEPGKTNIGDTRNFARSYRRRLRAEVLLDAVSDLTEVPEVFAGLPLGSRAIETWSNNIGSEFLDAFGRPDSSEDCTCDRDPSSSLVQALHLMNSDRIQSKIAHEKGRVARLVGDEDMSMKDIINEVYLAAYSRPPAPEELEIAAEILFDAPGLTRKTAAEDIMWALINSAEFVFNH